MVKGRGPTSMVHTSLHSAEEEADRLARVNPGEAFIVLEAVSAHVKTDVERIDLRRIEDESPLSFFTDEAVARARAGDGDLACAEVAASLPEFLK